jgi:hypothetical protein
MERWLRLTHLGLSIPRPLLHDWFFFPAFSNFGERFTIQGIIEIMTVNNHQALLCDGSVASSPGHTNCALSIDMGREHQDPHTQLTIHLPSKFVHESSAVQLGGPTRR